MEFTTIGNARKETGLAYLGNINSSAKMSKNMKTSNNYTYVIYLAPANTSGYNVCSHSTPECRLGCLATSGRTRVEIYSDIHRIRNSRIQKTKLFYEHPKYFIDWMIAEIKYYQRKAKKDGYDFSVRLNGTSDIDWSNIGEYGKTIFDLFPEVQFYDYTKNPHKFVNKPANYHLTFSYTGRNWNLCESVLKAGYNVAVVFNTTKNQSLPATFNGYEVINGDLTDYRPLDGNGVIVGLRFKRIANREAETQILNSCFVAKSNVQTEVLANVQELKVA
jgi:hypothetical protein